ncbi:phosphopantetheine-binding protein [Paenibacillus sp. sgz5001063]|uniref:phosphopantetheine-binding protein n=1 Tax=Paenibacillus sp. sgz5001063 TaxID=3242474 RepID=UPI0036D20F1B
MPVPEELIIVDSIGKNISSRELLNMYEEIFKQESVYVKPCNAIEAYLVKLWGELLPVGRISVTDDFFALGGHSLLVAQMHFAIERDMGMYMNFELMLRTSVLSELALIMTQMKNESKL